MNEWMCHSAKDKVSRSVSWRARETQHRATKTLGHTIHKKRKETWMISTHTVSARCPQAAQKAFVEELRFKQVCWLVHFCSNKSGFLLQPHHLLAPLSSMFSVIWSLVQDASSKIIKDWCKSKGNPLWAADCVVAYHWYRGRRKPLSFGVSLFF